MRVLLVEDEPAVRDAVARALRVAGHELELANDGQRALELANGGGPFDAIVLDLGLPKVDGIEVCRRLRAAGSHVPVLMLTARAAVSDRVEGLDAGADDYVVKPFALDELLARLRVFDRRSGSERAGVLRFADIVLDRDAYTCRRGERAIPLTRTEHQLLELFMRNPRRVLSRDVIFDRVWGYDFGPDSNSLDVYIGYLRRKLESGGEPRVIHTIRGVGYKLSEPEAR